MRVISFSKTIYDLTEEYPELIEILAGIGFAGVKNPLVRNTFGRKTTLAAGCRKQQKDVNEVVRVLKENGFEVKELKEE